jgi:type IV pilus assembly protein PilW
MSLGKRAVSIGNSAASRPRGFSIVELMVAITLALIVTTGVLAVFLGSRSSFQSTSGVAALADNGRFALNFIQAAVRSAGYMACNTTQRQLSMLNAGPTPVYYNFTQPLWGYEANATGGAGAFTVAAPPVTPDGSTADWAVGLDPALAGLVIKNSDVLVVYSTLRNAQPTYVTAITDGASNFTVNTQGSLLANQIAVISDCSKSVAFQITSITAVGPNAQVSHTAAGAPGNTTTAFSLSFPVGAQVAPIDTTVFYIGQGADGDGALFSYDLYDTAGAFTGAFTANELVPDIEAMQVLYGLDTNGTQTVGEYVTADQVPDFNLVMSVKIAVLAASPAGSMPRPAVAPTFTLLGNTVTAPIDNRMRQVFEITVSMRDMET